MDRYTKLLGCPVFKQSGLNLLGILIRFETWGPKE